jgi:protein-glutamine gamma-glutamyltransferase
MTRRLARAGFPQRPDEGPLDYAARVAATRPEWAGRLQVVARAYVRSRYLEDAPVDELARAVRRFRTT